MCNCSKPIDDSDCARLIKKNNDPLKRFFIYHIFDDERGLQIAHVEKGKNPNVVAHERGFYNENGQLEWYSTHEHPCIKNNE